MAEYELKVVKRDTAANTAVECEAARTEVREAEQGLRGCEMKSAERVAAGYEVTEVKAADRGLAGCKMESKCEVAGYEVKADKRETVEMESAERDAVAAKAAERDAAGNEVKAVERPTVSYEMESEYVVVGYEVQVVKRKTAATEATESDMAVMEAAERDEAEMR